MCSGSGNVSERWLHGNRWTDEQRRKATTLRAKGLSFRKIGAAMGIKHAWSVKHLIEYMPKRK